MINRTSVGMAFAYLAMQAAAPVVLADDSKCCVRLTPYYWAVGIDGKLEDNRGPTTTSYDFSNDFSDMKDNLDYNGSLLLEFHKGHWANYAQIDAFQTTNDDLGDVRIGNQTFSPELEAKTTLASAATGYRFDVGERSSIDLMVGVRYAKLDIEAKTRARHVSGDSDLTDGIVMVRPRLAIGKNWAFNPTWAVGAGDSDLTYELAPEFVWTNACCNLEVRLGYRDVHYEYEENSVKLDFDYKGPMVGVGFAF